MDIPLINCNINLFLTWYKNCVIRSKAARDAGPDADPAVAAVINPTTAIFKITDTKLYVPADTLSTEDDNKLEDQWNTGFRRTVKWNKYRPKMTKKTKTNNLNDMIHHLIKSINYLSYYLKMKRKENIFFKVSYNKS